MCRSEGVSFFFFFMDGLSSFWFDFACEYKGMSAREYVLAPHLRLPKTATNDTMKKKSRGE